MNKKDLFNAIGDISDDLIIEAGSSVKKVMRIRMSRVIALSAAIIVLFGLTVFAISVTLSGRSSQLRIIPDYYSVPTRQMIERDIGIQLNVINTFSNGYLFKSGYITYNQDYDENGNVFEEYKGFHCEYEHDGSDLSFVVDAAAAGNQMEHIDTAGTYKGCGLKYYSYINKIVPGSYELTEQDEKDRESGRYVFSYGGNDVAVHNVQGLGWEY